MRCAVKWRKPVRSPAAGTGLPRLCRSLMTPLHRLVLHIIHAISAHFPSRGEQAALTRARVYGVSTSMVPPEVCRLTDYCRERNAMARPTSSNNDEEDLALALRLSQLSSDTSDEHISGLYHTRSASASPATRSSTPPSIGENNNLALASRISQRSPNTTDEQGQSVASNQSAPARRDSHQTAPQPEFDDVTVIGLISSGLQADISDEQTGEPSQYGDSSMTDRACAGTQVWVAWSLQNLDH